MKINAVIVRGLNDDEIVPLIEFCRTNGFSIRFIEYMDVGNANSWSLEKTVTKQEILQTINQHFPLREVGRMDGRAPAIDYQFLDGTGDIGIIGSVTEPFCGTCTRARLTADGKLVTCLFAQEGRDLKSLMRRGATDQEIGEVIRSTLDREEGSVFGREVGEPSLGRGVSTQRPSKDRDDHAGRLVSLPGFRIQDLGQRLVPES